MTAWPQPLLFAFERLVRNEGGERELEIGRALSFPLLDLLLLPARTRIANAQQQIRLRMAGDVVQALNTQRDFWLADAALQAALIGRPAAAGVSLQALPTAAGGGSAGGHRPALHPTTLAGDLR